MNSWQRRVYMISFILLFLIIAPLVVFLARGYRFDNIGKIFVYSGSITVKTFPQDVNIYLDGKKIDKRMINVNNSYTINGIKPGKYLLKCEKTGYTGWEKNIEVHSGISTEFWNLVLLPEEKQDLQNYTTEPIKQFFISPRENKEIVLFSEKDNEREIYLLDTENNEQQKIFSTSDYHFVSTEKEENIEWSTDNKRLLIPFLDKKENKNYVITKIKKDETRDDLNLHELFNENEDEKKYFEKVRWMFDRNDELVVLTTDHELYYFDLSNPDNKMLLDEQVSSFDFSGNRIYYSQLPNNFIWEIKNNDVNTKRQVTHKAIESNPDLFNKLIAYDEYRIALINDKKELFIFNEEKEEGEVSMEKIYDNVSGIQLSDDGKKLLFWTDNEIWVLMLREWEVQPLRQKGDKFLITRFSQPVKNVQWMDNYENVLFSVGPSIKSVEIDLRDHVNVVNVMNLKNDLENRDIFYNKDNQVLLFKDKNQLKSMILVDRRGFLGL
jgi:PEGA domain